MRFIAALLFWLMTTVAARGRGTRVVGAAERGQRGRIRGPGREAAKDPAAAGGDGLRAVDADHQLAADSGYALNNYELVRGVTAAYTANSGFPGQFAQANRIAHRWMFTDSVQHDQADGDRWLVDIAPMLKDDSLRQTLGSLDLNVPETLTVPITVPSPRRCGPVS